MSTDVAVADRLGAMGDLEVVRFFEHWASDLCDGAVTDLEAMTAAVPIDIRRLPRFDEATDVESERSLDPATAAVVARAVLLPAAEDPALAPTVAAALETFEDNRLVVDVILAMGLVASVLLILSTTEFECNVGGLHIRKGSASPELVKAVLEGVAGLLGSRKDS